MALYITVNQEALKYWYKVTGHIGEQNIKLLPETVTGIDLFSLPDLSGDCNYVVYAEIRIKLKPSKGHIEPGTYQNELIYSDLIGPIEGVKADYKWVVTFTEDITKVVHMALLPDSSYETVLRAFQGYAKRIYSPDRLIRRLYTDDNGIYSGFQFNNWRYAEGIR